MLRAVDVLIKECRDRWQRAVHQKGAPQTPRQRRYGAAYRVRGLEYDLGLQGQQIRALEGLSGAASPQRQDLGALASELAGGGLLPGGSPSKRLRPGANGGFIVARDGVEASSGGAYVVKESAVLRSLKHEQGEPGGSKVVIDLGAGEGGYGAEILQRGADEVAEKLLRQHLFVSKDVDLPPWFTELPLRVKAARDLLGPNATPAEIRTAEKAAAVKYVKEVASMSLDQVRRIAEQNAFVRVASLEDNGPRENLKSWPLICKFYRELQAKPVPSDNKPVPLAVELFLSNATELFKVQCNGCNGWGHTIKYCPTWPRVRKAAGPNKDVQGWLSQAAFRVYKDVKPGLVGGPPDILGVLSQLPYQLPEGFLEKGQGAKRKGKAVGKNGYV